MDETVAAEADYNVKHAESLYQDVLSQGHWWMNLTWAIIALAGIGSLGLAFAVIRGISKALTQCADEISISAAGCERLQPVDSH